MNEKNNNKGMITLIIIIVLVLLFFMSMNLADITVLDPEPLTNITLQINIT